MSIKRTDRMREVLSLLRERGEVTSQVLCTELRISAATLRRDLSELEEQGLLVRTHGGARAVDPSDSEIPVRLRDHRMVAIKRRIAQHAAALVPPGQQAVASPAASPPARWRARCVADRRSPSSRTR